MVLQLIVNEGVLCGCALEGAEGERSQGLGERPGFFTDKRHPLVDLCAFEVCRSQEVRVILGKVLANGRSLADEPSFRRLQNRKSGWGYFRNQSTVRLHFCELVTSEGGNHSDEVGVLIEREGVQFLSESLR